MLARSRRFQILGGQMNSDIRLSTEFWQHPKTRKLAKRLGLEGVRSIQILWLWAARNKPDGNLSGMDWEDIELAADWQGEEHAFFDHCLGVWIDEAGGRYALHDWAEHNPWQADADDRSDKARFSRLATVNRPAYDRLKAAGVNAISKDDYERLMTVKRPLDESPTTVDDRSTTVSNDRQTTVDESPTTAPAPALKGIKNLNIPVRETGDLRRARSPERGKDGVGENSNTSPPVPAGTGDEPSLEFIELREMYSRLVRPEGELSGFIEYKQAKASRDWPGLGHITDDIDKRLSAGVFRSNYGPSLRRYLAERFWKTPIPQNIPPGKNHGGPPGTLAERNMATVRAVLAEMEGET